MIKTRCTVLAILFASLLPFSIHAEAPVVDESENFALLDDQQAAYERPVAKANNQPRFVEEERALATDSTPSSNSNNAMLLNKLQGLQQELQELRGQLEIQAHDLKLLQQQQLSFYKDLDTRVRHDPAAKNNKIDQTVALPLDSQAMLKTAEEGPKSAPNRSQEIHPKPMIMPIATSSARNNPAEEQISYLAAYELVKNKRYTEALPAMQSFAEKYPQGGYTANAHYWLGELYLVKKDYPSAITHFETVLSNYPSSSKAAASLLKTGYAFAAFGKKQEAIQRLNQVVKNYPDTTTAKLAKAKLEALGG